MRRSSLAFWKSFHVDQRGDPQKMGMLFLHGFLGSSVDWCSIMDTLSSEFFCVAPDLPGHGKTREDADEVFAMPRCASMLVDLLKQWPGKKWIVVGYSMGGRLALYLAIHHPKLFQAGVIISASPGLECEKERTKRRESDALVIQQLLSLPFSQFLERWYEQALFLALRHSDAFAELFAQRLKNDPLRLAKSVEKMGLGAQPSLWNDLSRCEVPLSFVVGEKDFKFVDLAHQMHRVSNRSQLFIISKCGHNPLVEKDLELKAILGSRAIHF